MFWILFSHFVCHNCSVPMMKTTGLSHLFKWENLHNWWLTKYFFAPLCVNNVCFFICNTFAKISNMFLLCHYGVLCVDFLNFKPFQNTAVT